MPRMNGPANKLTRDSKKESVTNAVVHHLFLAVRGGVGSFETTRGIASFAIVIGSFVLVVPAVSMAQASVPLECLPGSTGPSPGSSIPFTGGICDLGILRSDGNGFSYANIVSADGAVVVGFSQTNDGNSRAFRWVAIGGGMLDLGTLRADNLGISAATAVSADGSVVVGSARADDGGFRAFRWDTTSATMVDLGSFRADNLGYSHATSVSGDGSVVVGEAESDLGSNRAFRWDTTSANMVDLGSLRADNLGFSRAHAVSADGSVVVGEAESNLGSTRAFRWDTTSANMVDLGSLRADNLGYSTAAAVSADGAVVVGLANVDDGGFRAFRWDTTSANMVDLGSLRADKLGFSLARATSANGSVVVGSANTDDGRSRAFRWDTTSADMVDLGSFRADKLGFSRSSAVSADGGVVVGVAETDDGNNRAFRWDSASGDMLDLGTLRADNAGSSTALAVSSDGAVVVGEAETDDGNSRAFIWRTQMQDLSNLFNSFGLLANDTEIAVAQQQLGVARLMGQTCVAGEGEACISVGGWLSGASGSGLPTAITSVDGRTAGLSSVAYGRGLSERLTVGASVSLGQSNLKSNGFDMSSGLGASFWADFSAGGDTHLGWQAEASIGWGRESGSITRGMGLANVMAATGEADLETKAATFRLGYGFEHGNWLLTPSLSLTHFATKRSAYSENGADFNASYETLAMDRTTATAAVSADRRISELGTLSVELGVEHDLKADRAILSGISTIPGMETFSIESALQRDMTRVFGRFGYAQELPGGQVVSGGLQLGEAPFGSDPQVALDIKYSVKF